MGRNALVKEFVGRKDHKDYIKRGTAVENLFVDEAIRRGYRTKVASAQQNMYDHIDLILTKEGETFTVDINSGNLRLRVASASTNSTVYKFKRIDHSV